MKPFNEPAPISVPGSPVMPNEKDTSGCLLVAYDFSSNGDTGVVIVGKHTPDNGREILNMFQGKEAHDILEMLLPKK